MFCPIFGKSVQHIFNLTSEKSFAKRALARYALSLEIYAFRRRMRMPNQANALPVASIKLNASHSAAAFSKDNLVLIDIDRVFSFLDSKATKHQKWTSWEQSKSLSRSTKPARAFVSPSWIFRVRAIECIIEILTLCPYPYRVRTRTVIATVP